LQHADPGTNVVWDDLYYCWPVESPSTSCWAHCLDRFQHIDCGEMPNLQQMIE
jgi:hypothetical protein